MSNSTEIDKHSDMKLACSPSRFATTTRHLSEAHHGAIRSIGLGGLLHIKAVTLRRPMLVKIAKRYNNERNTFHICNQELTMTPPEVKLIMGLPIEGNYANMCALAPIEDSSVEIHKTLFNSYKTGNKITISELENMIRNSTVPNDDFKRQFVLYNIGTILAPTTKDYVDAKYLALVHDVSDIARFNWGKFTLSFLLFSIHNFKLKDSVSLQGNLPLLQVWYWEHVRPYPHHGVVYSPTPFVPLMARWGEHLSKQRHAAYEKDQLDGGQVIKNLAVLTNTQQHSTTHPTMPRHENIQSHLNGNLQGELGDQHTSNQQMKIIL